MHLAWALDREGAKVHADRLDPRARGARAPFTCLGCGGPLVPRLGSIRARHFAHLPGSTCPLTAPESALHLDAKERLLALFREAFSGARRVLVVARCPSCRRPVARDLAALGDSAEEEASLGTLRVDVLVRRAGTPSLAVEVRVTHAVEPEKEAALASAAVPAVEIDARGEWEGDSGGAATVAAARAFGLPPCAPCAAAARADLDRARGGEAAEVAELESYRARGLLGTVHLAPAAAALAEAALGAPERAGLARRFRCPVCGGRELSFGERVARHACPGEPARPVAWRGYDGSVVELRGGRRA